MKNFRIEKGKYGRRMVLQSELTVEAANYCTANNIAELEFNWAKGFRGTLENLPLAKNLSAFEICDYTIEDISQIDCLENLQSLTISTYCKTPIDFSRFKKLKELSFFFRPKVSGLNSLDKLKSLFIYKYNPKSKDLSELAEIKNLKSLSLKTASIESIGNIEGLKNLESLGIFAATKLKNTDGLKGLFNLRTLELETCSSIENIDFVSALDGLEILNISNCKAIVSLEPVRKLVKLSELRFAESTNVTDGNIGFIKDMSNIRKVVFQNRRHYDLKRQ